jgi:hypothetical protein
LLVDAPTGQYSFYYPRNYIAPDGRLFGYDTDGRMYFVTTNGTGSISAAGQLDAVVTGTPSTSVMYRPGKILQISSKSNRAVTIDIDGDMPVVEPTSSLSSRRAWANSTVLPDGRVLVTGGSGQPDQLIDVNNSAEIWDPDTGNWSVGPSGKRPRLYHSFALLLPDASVLVGGGGASANPPINNFHAEIYYPPYLYDSSGALALRPVIETAPQAIEQSQSFTIAANPSGIDRVTLVRAGAATHGVNLEQRFVELAFSMIGGSIAVEMPARAAETPPGYYLLFVLNSAGVPSRAKIVRVNIRTTTPPPPVSTPNGGGGATGFGLLALLGLLSAFKTRSTDR